MKSNGNGYGNVRRNNFKSTNDVPQQSRKVREETTLQLRKDKKDERIKTRRMMASVSVPVNEIIVDNSSKVDLKLESVHEIFQMWDKNPAAHEKQFFEAIQNVRRLLSVQRNPPVDAIIDAGLLVILFKALSHGDDHDDLQFEAAWAITNLASTHRTKAVAEHPGLVHEMARLLLQGRSALVREQCAWCLGNIAGESPEYREGLLSLQAARDGFVFNLIDPANQSLLKNFVWATCNLVRNSSHHPPKHTLAFVDPLLRRLAASSFEDDEVRSDACYALGFLAEGDPENGQRAQVLLDYHALDILMKILIEELKNTRSPRSKVLVPLVRCLGMFVIGKPQQADALLQADILKYIPALFRTGSKALQKEAGWVCSNIAAGTIQQADALAKQSVILMELVDAAQSQHWDVRKEALWTFCNLLSNQIDQHTQAVLAAGSVTAFCASLDSTDTILLCALLDGFDVMFQYDKKSKNPNLAIVIEEDGGIDKLERLLQHRNDMVYQKALKIIEDHIGTEQELIDEDGDESMDPENAGSSFNFGLPAKKLFSDSETPSSLKPGLGSNRNDM